MKFLPPSNDCVCVCVRVCVFVCLQRHPAVPQNIQSHCYCYGSHGGYKYPVSHNPNKIEMDPFYKQDMICAIIYVWICKHIHTSHLWMVFILAQLHVRRIMYLSLHMCTKCEYQCCYVCVSKSSLILQFCNRINHISESLYCRDDHVLHFVVTRDSQHCSVQTILRKP